MLTNQDILMMLEKQTVNEVICDLLNEYEEKIGTKASLYNRINRLKTGKPKKRNDSTECIEWANRFVYQEQVLIDDDSDMEIE